jgi:hypothetical protein
MLLTKSNMLSLLTNIFAEQDLHKILSDAVALPAETEIVEFKEAKEGFDFDKIGQYFSALSNEANLKGKSCAWPAPQGIPVAFEGFYYGRANESLLPP